MTDPDQLRRQNLSLIATLAEIDLAILSLNDEVEFPPGSSGAALFARLLAGARARDTANHAGDLIAGGR